MDNKGTFNILTLSGGGYRGLYTAKVLAEIEEKSGKKINQMFDLIAGTSIGGILALALSAGIDAKEMLSVFLDDGGKIFKKRGLLGFYKAPFDKNQLKESVKAKFGEIKMGELSTRVIIPTINYSTGKPQVFKTPHHENFISDHKHLILDVALATSAAPTYFPRYIFNSQNQYVDGGLFANNPGLLALHEAEHFLEIPTQTVNMVYVGTMGSTYTVDPHQRQDGGLIDWGRGRSWRDISSVFRAPESIISLGISVQESMANFMLKHKLPGRYTIIDCPPSDYSSQAVGLSKADVFADAVLLSNAVSSAQTFLGTETFRELAARDAIAPIFYHGPKAAKRG